MALVTAMDRPLGQAIGNALEVSEAVECLRGEGPSDLGDVVVALTSEMLVLGGAACDVAEAEDRCRETLASGVALERFGRLVDAQGGRRVDHRGPGPAAACTGAGGGPR